MGETGGIGSIPTWNSHIGEYPLEEPPLARKIEGSEEQEELSG
jgi:hypothetical protein